jgi:hypothetical protein
MMGMIVFPPNGIDLRRNAAQCLFDPKVVA